MKDILYEKYHARRKLQRLVINEKNFTYRNLIEILKKYIKPNISVLDIGCGTGAIDFFLSNRGCKVTGLDISENAIKIAMLNSKNLGFEKKTNYFVAKFPNIKLHKKYDLIICSEVLEHLSDDRKAVILIHDLLKKRGVLVASSPSVNAPLFRLGLLNGFDKEVGHLRRYDSTNYTLLFRKCRFKIINTIKKEGVLRNFLFTNRIAGEFVRIIRGPISDIVTLLDNLTLPIFGESQIFIIATKK